MLLKSIKYKNFRPFLGEQYVNLSGINKEKNVVVLLGDNTAGKTTFILSFVWCLYGESKFNKHESILNEKVVNTMTEGSIEEAFVEVEFYDDNKLYIVKRMQKFKKQAGELVAGQQEMSMVYTDENGKSIAVNDSEYQKNIIRAILPYELSSYFFFEGEKDNQLNKKELGAAVRRLLGLAAFDNMKKHLFGPAEATRFRGNSVLGRFNAKQIDDNSEEAKSKQRKLKEIEEAISELKGKYEALKNAKAEYKEKIEEIQNKLREAEPSKEIQKRIDALEEQLIATREDLDRRVNSYIKNFGNNSLDFLIQSLLPRIQSRLENLDILDKGIRGIEAAAIDALLSRGKCICGTQLHKGCLAYEEVAKYYDILPPKSVGTLVLELQDRIEASNTKSEDFIVDSRDTYKEIISKRYAIDKIDKDLTFARKELESIGNVDVEKLEERRKEYARHIEELEEDIEETSNAISTKEEDANRLGKELDKFKKDDKNRKFYSLCFDYANLIYRWVAENYEKKESEMRDKLNKYVSEIFKKMYTGQREIYIDPAYKIVLKYEGNEVDDTGGLRAVQYFAYVASLVKLAYEVMYNKGSEINKMGEEYPLVLDAAFSHADESHTKNVARELATSVNQLIFALMYKDWNYAKEGLEFKLARKYELKKIDEIEVQIVEVK